MSQDGPFSRERLGHRRPIVSALFGSIPLDFLKVGDAHPCPYLPGKTAREEAFTAGVFPSVLYKDFMDHGFRRAGYVIYRPVCDACSECRSLRVPVANFAGSKSQRRVYRKNADLDVRVDSPKYSLDKYRMYCDYLAAQHDSAVPEDPEEFRHFLYSSPVSTIEFEYRLRGRLVASAVADEGTGYLSSVYAFFDPEFSHRSLGTFSVLHELLVCAKRSIGHYYLGYYVADSRSMSYKARFKPHEVLNDNNEWGASSVRLLREDKPPQSMRRPRSAH